MQYSDWGGHSQEDLAKIRKQTEAESKANKLMFDANYSLKQKNSSVRYRLMQTFLAYNDDILLSLIEVTTKKDIYPFQISYKGIISCVPTDPIGIKPIRLFEYDYQSNLFEQKEATTTDHKYISSKNLYFQIKDYFIHFRDNTRIISFIDLYGEEVEHTIPIN